MDPLETRHRIRRLLEPTVRRLGFDLVAVEWTGDQKGAILRLSIDGPRGVTIADCALVSEYVSPLLDEDDPIAAAYRLEVSSPGIERPVERPEDFGKLAGYRAKVRLFEGHPRRNYAGRLQGVTGDELRIVVDGVEHPIPLDAIERAHLVLDLDEYQELGERLYGKPEDRREGGLYEPDPAQDRTTDGDRHDQ